MRCLWPVLLLMCGCAAPLKINQIQFIGSHNSYKLAMSPEHAAALEASNPAAARSLDYEHVPLAEQLDLGLRKLELDVFYRPDTQSFVVGHVQVIDMNTHCAVLTRCLDIIKDWSDARPRHVPIWISFNAKDQKIDGLPAPAAFDEAAFDALDRVLESALGDRLLRPRDVVTSQAPRWPSLADARGKLILVLDESGTKRDLYAARWRTRPMFTTFAAEHPAAAIMIINDPESRFDDIRSAVRAGYMVRTRADADTAEARSGATGRRDRALASGAQAISTDYYLPDNKFGTDYSVPPMLRCNPVLIREDCTVSE